ncbi:MAG: hypothetical protein ACI4LC_04230 [Emergencia sp.]
MASTLGKAFMEAMNNPALRYVDSSVDLLIIKTAMIAYLERNDYDFTVEEVERYIQDQFDKIHESLKDFSYNNKMMD